jgi:hypothetical protein
VVPVGGATIDLGNGNSAFLPGESVILGDGSIVISSSGKPAVFTIDGKEYAIPGGFTATPNDKSPLGYSFAFNSPFKDVDVIDPNAWFYGDVAFAYLNGLFIGTSDNEFSPNLPITRGQFITVLGRMENIDISKYGGSSFDDVSAGEYYAPYVKWGVENKLVFGVGGGLFEPNRELLREELFTLFARYKEFLGADLPETRQIVIFSDAEEIEPYAKEALESMVRAGIAKGVGENAINPKGKATRAETAAIIHRLSAKLGFDFLEPA